MSISLPLERLPFTSFAKKSLDIAPVSTLKGFEWNMKTIPTTGIKNPRVVYEICLWNICIQSRAFASIIEPIIPQNTL